MRKLYVMVLTAAIGASSIGGVACGSAWWTNFTQNPVAQVQQFEQGVQVALNDAQIAWVFVQPFIPANALPTVTQQYNNAVFAVNHALQVLNDAVNTAVNLQQSNPDFTALMTAVTDAVTSVLAIIQQYIHPAPAADAAAAPAGGAAAPLHPAITEATGIVANLVKTYHLNKAADAGAAH